MRRVLAVLLIMGVLVVATWLAFSAVGEVSPGWSLLVLIGGAAIQWAIYRRWGKPALDAVIQDLDEPDDTGLEEPERRFHDLVPYGSPTSRDRWARRHPWLASVYFTLLFGVFVVAVSLGLPPAPRNVVLAAYVVLMPIGFRIGLERQWRSQLP